MQESKFKKPLFGKPYIQHYENGKKSGTTHFQKNIFTGKSKHIHKDSKGNKIGSSLPDKDMITGKGFIQNYDNHGNATSHSFWKKDWRGRNVFVTKEGKKRTTQELLSILIIIGLVIYFVLKVIIPFLFISVPLITFIIAIINRGNKKTFNWPVIISIIYIADYLLGGYSKYLFEDKSYISNGLYLSAQLSIIIIAASLIWRYNDLVINYLTNKGKNTRSNLNISRVLLFSFLSMPLFFMPHNYYVDFNKENIHEQVNQSAVENNKEQTINEINTNPDTKLSNSKFVKHDMYIEDTSTRLFWLIVKDLQLTYDEANVLISRTKEIDEQSDWRIPTYEEIKTLYSNKDSAGIGYNQNGIYYPAKMNAIFNDVKYGSWFWVKSEKTTNNKAQAINMHECLKVNFDKDKPNKPVQLILVNNAIKFKVKNEKAYFHDQANTDSKKNTYLIWGEFSSFKNSKNDFIWVDFTNETGIKTSGYILKDDIEIVDVSVNMYEDRD